MAGLDLVYNCAGEVGALVGDVPPARSREGANDRRRDHVIGIGRTRQRSSQRHQSRSLCLVQGHIVWFPALGLSTGRLIRHHTNKSPPCAHPGVMPEHI